MTSITTYALVESKVMMASYNNIKIKKPMNIEIRGLCFMVQSLF